MSIIITIPSHGEASTSVLLRDYNHSTRTYIIHYIDLKPVVQKHK